MGTPQLTTYSAILVMGTSRMCETGGCGYFSDDGK